MSARAFTPIVVGVGQAVYRGPVTADLTVSPVTLAAEAAVRALADAQAPHLNQHVDVLALTRTFSDSAPQLRHRLGGSANPPRSVAARIKVNPARAVYEVPGGQSPQRLVNEFAGAIARGAHRLVLLAGAEAIAIVKQAQKNNIALDWNEDPGGALEDRGTGGGLLSGTEVAHGIHGAPAGYALIEHARRARLGMTREAYRRQMAELFAPFSAVAARNPYAQFPTERDVEYLAAPSADNYPISDPYLRWLIAQDSVNQGAAVLLTSAETAQDFGIPREKWVYLLGGAEADDTYLSERPDLSRSRAMQAAGMAALEQAGVSAQALRYLDIYSCFPCAVFAAAEGLGLDLDDTRSFTLTGGLPFFGGAGNNYSMHGIAEMVTTLRRTPNSYGMVLANGGILSKQSAGVYATAPRADGTHAWSTPNLSADLKKERVTLARDTSGPGTIDTYTVLFDKGWASRAIVCGHFGDGRRFLATNASDDAETPQRMAETDAIGRPIQITAGEKAATFSLA